ncbi:MAG: carbohydrate ABC transporter permease [Lachnospiraceae bacterium]|jgi:putative aldouronate transport system permease protein|nr:carbohydrate ABC transporter permease [Lachnospiraceae bacterium]MCH4070973.1 carbohydrate ABC transporter permease [Lachnospiraceae bacterium]MCH4107960.1 carbohydrate ABC transporter permease [Lachnospiraceae bacterium]MCI1302427.1 carbohydrate ABC transporter permease [Lachnospiraceae bacterium]MCI1332599.1 carbohydrate ABC transporter permease [Lachnospiraceae bacterium]
MAKNKNKNNKHQIHESAGSRTFDVVNVFIMLFLCVVTLYPMWYILCASFSNNAYVSAHPGTILWPHGFTAGSYMLAFTHPLLISGYANTLIVLLVSLPINMLLTIFAGYFWASKNVMLKKPFVIMIMITMFFNAGMIPNYLNVRSLGLYNSLWSLILPGALSVFDTIICRTAIEGIPHSLVESAYLDGANDLKIVFKIIMPLIKPTLAVLLLYYGVGHWNAWFNASIYIKDNDRLPIQNIMRSILIANSNLLNSAGADTDQVDMFADTIKYSTIILTTVPVLCVYPFLQKYFVKGIMVGAVKE